MKKIFLPCLLVLVLSSCDDKGKITVQNKVHNVTLNKVSWDGYSIASSVLPGEMSKTLEIRDKKENFPKISVVKFYMTRGGNQVYLETKSTFVLDAGGNLLIVIADDTQVINPAAQ